MDTFITTTKHYHLRVKQLKSNDIAPNSTRHTVFDKFCYHTYFGFNAQPFDICAAGGIRLGPHGRAGPKEEGRWSRGIGSDQRRLRGRRRVLFAINGTDQGARRLYYRRSYRYSANFRIFVGPEPWISIVLEEWLAGRVGITFFKQTAPKN